MEGFTMKYIKIIKQVPVNKEKIKYLHSEANFKRYKCPNCSGRYSNQKLRKMSFNSKGVKVDTGFYCENCMQIYLIDDFKWSKIFQADVYNSKKLREIMI